VLQKRPHRALRKKTERLPPTAKQQLNRFSGARVYRKSAKVFPRAGGDAVKEALLTSLSYERLQSFKNTGRERRLRHFHYINPRPRRLFGGDLVNYPAVKGYRLWA
jgi:hypothetical protein